LPIKKIDIPVHHYGRLDTERLAAKGESYYLIGKKKLEEKGGSDPKALFELAVQAGELKKFEEARLLFEKLVSLNPKYPLALFNLGFTYMELGLYQEALEATRKAYDLDPEYKECAINYAHCEIVAGNIIRGVSLLEKILEKVPEYAPALAVLSAGYYLCARKEEGLGILADLTRKGFNCTGCLHDIALGLHATGRFKEAVTVIEAAAKSSNVRSDTSEILKKSYDAYMGTGGVVNE
jgi:tetratricopeptide (TPR) repeat protein